jgi:signal transduction histidine kinase
VAARGRSLVEGSARLARVVVGNVLGNALNHGDGAVDLAVDGAQLTVRNPALARSDRGSVEGFGFGLAIAGDLCARFGWRLQARDDDGVFTVVVDFAPRPDAAVG